MTTFADYMRTQTQIEQRFTDICRPFNLKPVEMYVLYGLTLEGMTPHASTLARFVGRAATSFTPTLDGLEARGLIRRCADPNDRRAVLIEPTERGAYLTVLVIAAIQQMEAVIAELWLVAPTEAITDV